MFHTNAHDTKGTAMVLDLGAGRRVFASRTSQRRTVPTFASISSPRPDVKDDATVTNAGFVELGPMKGTSAIRTTRSRRR
jgi:hypothetical protein